jgi:hypothetical protein
MELPKFTDCCILFLMKFQSVTPSTIALVSEKNRGQNTQTSDNCFNTAQHPLKVVTTEEMMLGAVV